MNLLKNFSQISDLGLIHATSGPSYLQANEFFSAPSSFLLKGDFVFSENCGNIRFKGDVLAVPALDNILHPSHSESFKKALLVSEGYPIISLDVEDPVLLTASWSTNNCYHFFVDVVGKLALLERYYDLRKFNFLIPSWGRYYSDFFAFLGLKVIPYDRNFFYDVRNLLVPSLPGISNRINCDTLAFLRKSTRDLVCDTGINYFIRRKTRGVENELELLDLIRARVDLCPVFLEDFSLIDQVKMIGGSNLVIGPHGAGFAFTAFKKFGHVVEIFSEKFTNPPYRHMHAQSGIPYSAYFSDPLTGFKFGANHFDDFYVDPYLFTKFFDSKVLGCLR